MLNVIKMDNLKELPNRADHMCFGCGPVNTVGLRMKFLSDGKAVYSKLTIPDHLCGWDSLAHGGVVSTVLDEIMSWTAIHLLKRFIVTKSIAVDFLKPIRVGHAITAKGHVMEQQSDRQALMGGCIYNDQDELCAQSTGTFALLTHEIAKRMGILGDDTLKSFEHIIKG